MSNRKSRDWRKIVTMLENNVDKIEIYQYIQWDTTCVLCTIFESKLTKQALHGQCPLAPKDGCADTFRPLCAGGHYEVLHDWLAPWSNTKVTKRERIRSAKIIAEICEGSNIYS